MHTQSMDLRIAYTKYVLEGIQSRKFYSYESDEFGNQTHADLLELDLRINNYLIANWLC